MGNNIKKYIQFITENNASEDSLNIVYTDKDRKLFVNDRLWGKKHKGMDIGDYILNALFYINGDGSKKIKVTIDGVDETEDFKKQVKDKYQNIPNTELRDRFFRYTNVEEN